MAWGGGHRHATLDENLRAMDEGVREYMDKWGLG
jgi:hypothetical protein